MDITKSGGGASPSGIPDEKALSEISRLSKRKLSAEEVYVFSVRLCDNEVDRDFEQFTPEALERLSHLMTGKTGIFDHDTRAENQCARLYSCEVVREDGALNSLGEPYLCLIGHAYMLRSANKAELIDEIEAGIKKEISISCAVGGRVCSVCGKDARVCGHLRGALYGGKLCYSRLCEPTDAYEWSFVAVPAQKNAGVMKSFGGGENMDVIKAISEGSLTELSEDVILPREEALSLSAAVKALLSDADAGREYKAKLRNEVTRLACLLNPSLPNEIAAGVMKKASTDELEYLKKAFSAQLDEKFPIQPQTASPKTDTAGRGNDGFRI